MSSDKPPISVQFFQPPAELQPYMTALYLTELDVPDGEWVIDYLHPERAAFRFTDPNPPRGHVGPGELSDCWRFTANGPTSKSVWFSISRARCWGIGLHPAGWAKFVDAPANELADTIVDGEAHPAFSAIAPVASQVFANFPDAEAEAARIVAHFQTLLDRPVPQEEEILACQEAILDPDVSGVKTLSERLGISERSVERLCKRYFGFTPILLLRRQRFLRSLAQYMLDPRSNWTSAMDEHYHDQAQFTRDFQKFMGMTPRDYANRPHPILNPIMRPRMADLGAADPVDLPTILRYGDDEESE